jgi:hypothetical protein
MTSTSDAIADSISQQYAAVMDHALDDAARMETQRDDCGGTRRVLNAKVC